MIRFCFSASALGRACLASCLRLAAVWGILLFHFVPVWAQPAPESIPRILVINSYHPGYNWSDGEQAGLMGVLLKDKAGILPNVEYLDWRRFPVTSRIPVFLDHLRQKFYKLPFDLIIALDDPAIALVLEHRDFFGRDVPVVFGGVNDVDPDFFRKHSGVTGVAQTYDYAGTLALIRQLQPEVRKIAAVHCRTESGLASRKGMEKVIARNEFPFQYEWIEGWTAESLLQRFRTLQSDTAVLLLSIFRDEAGRVLIDDDEFGRRLAAECPVPIYFLAPPMIQHFSENSWETAVWQGMGGSLLSADLHGEMVGKLALRILKGERPDAIPIVTQSPSRVAFDYRQMQRFGISTEELPANAELYHAPKTFYQVNRSRIIAGLGIIAFLSCTVVLLGWLLLLRRRAENALRRSNAHFETIARATNDAVWDWDVIAGTVWWNENYRNQLHLSPQTTGSFSAWEEHVHPADRAWLVQSLHEILKTDKENWEVEYRLQLQDGETRHILDRIWIERDVDGKALRVLGARLDLTDRKQAEEERIHLAAAVEQSSEVIMLVELDGAIRYVNSAFERATGYASPKTIRQVYELLCTTREEQLTLQQISEQVTRTGHWTKRLEGVRRDGSKCVFYLILSPIRDRHEVTVGYVIVGEDVTRETKLEDQVRLSQKMEAVGLLAGGIAHDFNNLLQVIGGFAVQAQSAADEQERVECLAQVVEAAGRAKELTRQLLVFSRKEQGQYAVLDLNHLLVGQMKMIRRFIDAHIEIDFQPSAEPIHIRGDQGQIEQVFMNLCINARDAIVKNGKIGIVSKPVVVDENYCIIHPWARPGKFVQVMVSDNGKGMDRDTQSRIFDPFFTTKPKDKGTGLGLAVVYGIVKKHDGLIHVYSEPDIGTCFKVYFPLCDQEMPAAAPSEDPAVEQGSGTILVAEDEDAVRNLDQVILTKAGYQVLVAADGNSALAIYLEQAEKIDLVMLDAIMPKMTGREVYQQIRVRDAHKPVLFCSGYSSGTLQLDFPADENLYMLEKPFSPGELLRQVAALLKGKQEKCP